jgi:hypothetical protein
VPDNELFNRAGIKLDICHQALVCLVATEYKFRLQFKHEPITFPVGKNRQHCYTGSTGQQYWRL